MSSFANDYTKSNLLKLDFHNFHENLLLKTYEFS